MTVVALSLAVLAGCGGDSEGGSAEAEGAITEVLETSFTTADPAQCEQVTLDALEQFDPGIAEGGDPAAICRKGLDESSSAESIEIGDIAVDDGTATAEVTPQGGTFGGSTVTVALVEDGGWKIDGFPGLRIDDRDAYLAAYAERAAAGAFGSDGLPPRDARCVVDDIRANVTTDELERSVTEGERGYLYDSVRSCVGAGDDLLAITFLIRTQLVNSGVAGKTADCIAGASIAGQDGTTLEEFSESREVQERVAKAAEEGAYFCARPSDAP